MQLHKNCKLVLQYLLINTFKHLFDIFFNANIVLIRTLSFTNEAPKPGLKLQIMTYHVKQIIVDSIFKATVF